MTQEEKDLLLKELCARLPYGVEVEYNNSICEVISIDKYNEEVLTIWKNYGYSPDVRLEEVKPYLFPLSSMTEEQSKIYHELVRGMFGTGVLINLDYLIDFFNRNHLDWRGLIPMGLAKDANNLNVY